MKSWYKYFKKIASLKTASVTFSLEDSWRIAQPKNLLNLCSDFINFIYYNKKLAKENFKPYSTDIEPDTSSSDFEGYTGIINFYINPEYDIKEYINAIDAWIEDKAIEGYKIEYSKNPDQSNSRSWKVFRINVIENPSEHYDAIPEINLANGNAMAILRLLGISTAGGDAYSGKMSLEELRKKIESVSKEQMQSEITPSGYLSDHAEIDMSQGVVEVDDADKWKGDPIQDEPPTSGVKVYQPGRDENYIDNRLQSLYEIVHYGLKNGFKYLVWG